MAERDDEAREAVRAAIEHLESVATGDSDSILESMDPVVVERETSLFASKFLSECMDMVTPDINPEASSPIQVEKFRDFKLDYETRKRLDGDYKIADLVSCLSMIDLVPTIRDRVGTVAAVVQESDEMLFAMRKYRVILNSIPTPRVEASRTST